MKKITNAYKSIPVIVLACAILAIAIAQPAVGLDSIYSIKQSEVALQRAWHDNIGKPQAQEMLHEAARDVRRALCTPEGSLEACPPVYTDVTVTSYNLVESQTDDDPCVGASGRNLCVALSEGDRVMAASEDLIYTYGLGGTLKWQDKILVSGGADPRCNGLFSLEDTMNERYSNAIDIAEKSEDDMYKCYGATLTIIGKAQ